MIGTTDSMTEKRGRDKKIQKMKLEVFKDWCGLDFFTSQTKPVEQFF